MRSHHIGLVLLLAAVAPRATRAGDPMPGFVDTPYVSGLSHPTAIAFLPDGRLLITEKGGLGGPGTAALKLFDGAATTTLLTLPVCTDSEMGLLGVAVDPDFARTGFVYLYRSQAGAAGCETSTGRFNQVVRGRMAGGSVDAGSLTVLIDGIRTDNGNHDGGVLRIGPDQKLYVGVGDSGLDDNQGGPGPPPTRTPRTSPRSTGRSCGSISTGRSPPTTRSSAPRARVARSGPTGSATPSG